ncbi:hypothetical protein ACF0H5_014863 [Mactra antiquata]
MGTGISTVCGSKRSVLIANSVRKLPTIREDDSDVDVDNELEIKPTSGKLHQAESRDSGIGENDIPGGFLFQRYNVSNTLKNSSESNNEKVKEKEKNEQNDETTRASRPHSCRLGHRGHKGGRSEEKSKKLSDSQISRLVRSVKPDKSRTKGDNNLDELSDDTLSLNSVSSVSPDRQVINSRPKSARKRVNRKNKNKKNDERLSAKLISDLDTSTDTETSDTDMLSIPDETGAFNRSKDESSRSRRGWVKNENFTDVTLTSSVVPRAGDGHTDMYRIVSGSYADMDINLAKKASERSISSIILTPMDGMITPTNSECCDAPDLCNNCEGHLDDLVTSVTLAVKQLKSHGLSTPQDYEGVLKSLRYQLVAMAMGYMCRQSTPRIQVKGNQTDLFSDNEWKVEIRLKTEDEEIIENSENVLAQRLAVKGKSLSRQDISILLAEHLKTIEKLQQVQEAGKLHDSFDNHLTGQRSAREDHSSLLPRRPQSARKLRKLNSGKTRSSPVETQSKSELPPICRSKGANSKHLTPRHSSQTSTGETTVISPESSPDANNRKSFNESGIDSETEDTDVQSVEEEDVILFRELLEAFRILWNSLTTTTVSILLEEYRKREVILIQTVIDHARKQVSYSKTSQQEKTITSDIVKDVDDAESITSDMGQSNTTNIAQSELDIKCLDDEFVKRFEEHKEKGDCTVDDFVDELTVHMKKTRLIRVQSFNLRQEGVDWNGNQRSNSFTGFGNTNTVQQQNTNSPLQSLKRQHSFTGGVVRQNSFAGSTRQNSFLRSLPGSRQNSYCRTRSRGSTGSSFTYSTTSSGISSGIHSELSDSSGSGTKSALSRELSYGVLTEFADIDEQDEESKTARENSSHSSRCDSLRPPSGRKSNGPRATSGQFREREKRRGQTQVHGLGLASVETTHTPLRKIEEDALPKVEECDSKVLVRSRPDSGIAVSSSSASYSSSELHKERDLDEHYITTSCHEMKEKVSKVLADQHHDLKSLVAAVTKGLSSVHSKAQALYCWLTSQNVSSFGHCTKRSNSPSGRLKAIHEKKSTYYGMYMDMLKIAGVKCEKVEGYVKSDDYLPGNTVQTSKFQHTWVAVSMDGHYRLVDPHYGAQGDKFVLEHYFATSPDGLILSHFPKDKKWLLMNQPATIEVFEGTLKTWPAMFHFNIRPLNMKSVIKTYDGKLSITVLLQNVAVNPQLEYAGPGPEIDSDILEEKIDHEIRDVDNAETYHVTLPQEGNYYFTVYAHVLEDCVDVPVFQYRIEYIDELL